MVPVASEAWAADLPAIILPGYTCTTQVSTEDRFCMAKNVGEMTLEELRDLIDAAVEERLVQLLNDPDSGLPMRDEVRERLLIQMKEVEGGERGETLEAVAARLDIPR